MIVVDASALVALGAFEPDGPKFGRAFARSTASLMTPINYVEAGMVLIGKGIFPGQTEFDQWLVEIGVEVSVDLDLSAAALAAYLRYGKGRHPARLNLGDCFAYALAKALNAPLLFKGNDFSQTDVVSAL